MEFLLNFWPLVVPIISKVSSDLTKFNNIKPYSKKYDADKANNLEQNRRDANLTLNSRQILVTAAQNSSYYPLFYVQSGIWGIKQYVGESASTRVRPLLPSS